MERTRSYWPRLLISLWLVAIAFRCSPLAAQPTAAQADAAGYTSLRSRLGTATPTGAGIVIEQVEASSNAAGTDYMPDTTDSRFQGKSFLKLTPGGITSAHATAVGSYLYGSQSFASGINVIDVYEADHWLGAGFLNAGGSFPLSPPSNRPKIANHSWIGTDLSNPNYFVDVLQRLDSVIERDDTISVVAVNNGAATDVPPLLASSYNAIAVGVSNGDSSYGPTKYGEGVGRVKPDLVAPNSKTSYAAPLVSGAAALLLQSAGVNPAAAHSETVKAILMAGAAKDAWSDWSRTQTQPLDLRYGAGQLNIDRSYQILTAGEQGPSPNTYLRPAGWSLDTFGGAGTRSYYFEVPAGAATDFSAVLTWDRHVTIGTGWSLAAINLKLYQAGPNFTVGSLVDQSYSTTVQDNVQHVFQRALPAGQYVLQVTRTDGIAANWDYALAWQLLPEPQWNGGGAGINWSEAANWGATATLGGAAPVSPQGLRFGPAPAGDAGNSNDFAWGTLFNGITFASGASAYTLAGNPIKLGGPVVNQSASNEAISLGLELVSGGGTFNTGAKDMTVSGAISGAGALMKSGVGSLTLSGSNSFTGGTTVSQGVLQVTGSRALPTGGSLSIQSAGSVVLASGLHAAAGLGEWGMAADSALSYGPVAYSAPAPPSTWSPSHRVAQSAPEPGTLVLLAAGAAVALFVWRRPRAG